MSTTHELKIVADNAPRVRTAPTPLAVTGPTKFHLSLSAHDLRGATEFLTLLLGVKPAQQHSDYAKFELTDPPVVLSLAPTDAATSAGLNHLGFRLPSRDALDALLQRLQQAGVPFDVENSVACCHSTQTKIWVRDPAGNSWEFYVLEEPGECAAAPMVVAPPCAESVSSKPAAAVWSHRLGERLPERIPFGDDALDEIVLEGTFNDPPTPGQPAAILREAARCLRSGGKLLLHGLTADRPLTTRPKLPGPAAAVQHVPVIGEIMDAVKAAGFAGLELTTFGETYRFQHAGAELRETRICAWRTDDQQARSQRIVVYRGPFSEVCDDSGSTFRRGEPTAIDESTSSRLRNSSAAEQFVFLEEPANNFSHNGTE